MLPKVVVGLSGGVDSSVVALLLKRAGFDVRGVYLKCYWTHVGCQSDLDRASAAKVASVLEIPFEVWDFEKEYRAKVVEYFYREYEQGRTPNPDVVCNREIKFGLFLKRALGTDSTSILATGHYARTGFKIQDSRFKTNNADERWVLPKFCQEDNTPDIEGVKFVTIEEYVGLVGKIREVRERHAGIGGNFSIFGGEDKGKDQSYFLYDIDESSFEYILYPLGNLTKAQVRRLAREAGLPTADRPDSTGICFIGEMDVEKFLKERIPEKRGEVVDIHGSVLGEHKGVQFYTIGQRHGFKITNFQFSNPKQIRNSKSQFPNFPLYVIEKDIKKNRLVVGSGEECKRGEFKVESSKLKVEVGSNEPKLFVRIRHLGEMIPCRVGWTDPRVSLSAADTNVSVTLKDSLKESSPTSGRTRSRGSPSTLPFERNLDDEDFERSTLNVELEYPVFGVAPGQSAVFYRKLPTNDQKPQMTADRKRQLLWRVVGGGVIAE